MVNLLFCIMFLLSHLFFNKWMLHISLAMCAVERVYVSSYYLLVATCALFCVLPALHRNPLHFNNCLSGCKASFEECTTATLFTKTTRRAMCNFASREVNINFISSFSSSSELLCWSSKVFCSVCCTLLYFSSLLSLYSLA